MMTWFVDGAIFAVGSAVVVWWSRKALLRPGSHGFYRFFAWEAILGLIVLNRRAWGGDPFSLHQLASWPLLLSSIVLVVVGIRTLAREGRMNTMRKDDALYAWEGTDQLVTTGIFGHIRHPMYTSLLALTWGAFFQAPSRVGAVVAALGSFCLLLTALSDERECRAWFGEAYVAYMRRTWRFIPYIY